jgi:hypothetical protein
MLESTARANALPVGFFARLIWQKSVFHPHAVEPDTRTGAHALGIVQFMPDTAIELQLLELFDPRFVRWPKQGRGRLGALPMNCHELIASLERSLSSVKAFWLQKGSIRNVPMSWLEPSQRDHMRSCPRLRASLALCCRACEE